MKTHFLEHFTVYEHADGTLELAGANGFVTIVPEQRKAVIEILSHKPPRLYCMACHRPSNEFICKDCVTKTVEKESPKVRWHILRNGKIVSKGTTSLAMAYVHLTATAYKDNARYWNVEEEYYENENGVRYQLHIPSPTLKEKQVQAPAVRV